MLREFVVGVTPEGFQEVQPLENAILEDRIHILFQLVLKSGEPIFNDEYFHLSELRTDRVLVPRRGVMTLEEFLKRDTCDH